MRVGGEIARQAAEQRHEAQVIGDDARHIVDCSRKRAAMADADDFMVAMLDLAAQKICTRMAKRHERQTFLTDVGNDFAIVEAVHIGETIFEVDTFGNVAVDTDFHRTVGDGFGNKAMRFHGGQTKALRNG